jgi:ABC-type polysaccharide/polyol phosphate export permease
VARAIADRRPRVDGPRPVDPPRDRLRSGRSPGSAPGQRRRRAPISSEDVGTERADHDASAAPPVAAPGASLRRSAILLARWTARDFHSRYRSSSLRAFWAILQPFFFVAVYVVIFGVIFEQTGGDLPFLSYLLGGVVVYRIIAAALSSGTCLVDNYSTISHANFPRAIIPMSQVLGNGIDVVVTVVGLIGVALVQGLSIDVTVILLPLVVAAVVVLAMGACIFVSTATVFVRDLQFAMTFVVMGLFFASPITYQPEQLPSWLAWLNWANPISVYVETVRDVTLRGSWPGPWFWVHLLGSVALLLLALAHLRAVEHRIVDLA